MGVLGLGALGHVQEATSLLGTGPSPGQGHTGATPVTSPALTRVSGGPKAQSLGHGLRCGAQSWQGVTANPRYFRVWGL